VETCSTCLTLSFSDIQIIYPRNEMYPEFEKATNIDRIKAIIEEVGLAEVVRNNGGLDGK